MNYKKEGDRLFSRVCGDCTGGNGFELEQGRFRLGVRKKFFTIKVVKTWNWLLKDVVDVLSLKTVKAILDPALSNLREL